MSLPRPTELSRVQGCLSESLRLRLGGLSFIKDNGTCSIYRAVASGEPVVVKQYRGHDPTLARREAAAVELYRRVCDDVPDAIPSRTVAFNPDTNTLCIAWVHGQPLSDVLERAENDSSAQRRCAHAMKLVGVLLRRLHETTRKAGTGPSPFLHEYMTYVSNGLEGLPILGRTLFRGYRDQADRLWKDLVRIRETPTTCHGDLALTNIRLRGYRAGLIDFANTNDRSHLLGDVYGLFVYLRTRRLPDALRRSLLDALFQGIGPAAYPDPVHRFHWEMQRRRWLFFKLVQGNAVQHLEGLRGMGELGLPLLSSAPISAPS